MLAQEGWSDDRIIKARNVLEHMLRDTPGTLYGVDKSIVANAMADRRATMVLFRTEEDLRRALEGPLGSVGLAMQDLRANECPIEGSEDYMAHRTRDASYEEILHLILYSAESPDARHGSDYVVRRGDFLAYDMGVEYLNFGTDFKRHAYVLREGEHAVPEPIQHAWNRGLEARRVVRKSIRVGRTASETLVAAAEALEAEGFTYTPFTDTWEKDREIVAALGDSEKTGVQIDCHTVGNTGNSEVAVGPSFAPFRPDRAHVMVQPNNIFSLELVAHTAIPTLRERRLVINFEDNAIVTTHGVEFLYPPNERIRIIH